MAHELNEIVSRNPERPLLSDIVFITTDEVLMEHAKPIVDSAIAGIKDVSDIMQTPLRISVVGSNWAEGDYGSVDWFTDRAGIQDESGKHQGKLLWNRIHSNLENDPNRLSSPHLGYMLLGRDMTALGPDNKVMNYIFGATDKEIGQTVQSIFRFIEAGLTEQQIILVTKHIARHEFGHLVGLDDTTIKNQDKRGGIYIGHCENDCTMQQVISVSESIELATKLEHSHNAGFCNDCTVYLSTR